MPRTQQVKRSDLWDILKAATQRAYQAGYDRAFPPQDFTQASDFLSLQELRTIEALLEHIPESTIEVRR